MTVSINSVSIVQELHELEQWLWHLGTHESRRRAEIVRKMIGRLQNMNI